MTQRSVGLLALCMLSMLSGCALRPAPAPIADTPSSDTAAQPARAAAPVQLPRAPKGFYRVQPGDTLSGIAQLKKRTTRELAAWNNLADPNRIEVDQLLRVVPPRPARAGAPVSASAAALASVPASVPASEPASDAALDPDAAPDDDEPKIVAVPAPDDSGPPLALEWPAQGPLLARFDNARNKGIDIGGTFGAPVRAAASGQVVYAGNGLRGYGYLVIVKSDASLLTAYAHNRDLKVKEGQSVTKGQVIAEMGRTDADRVMLHFEVRREGKPVDPLRYLPAP